MTNAELIKALRCRANDIRECEGCAFKDACYGGTLELVAADALEAAEQRIARLEEDLKTREAEREVMQDTIKICEEANDRYKARLPKEGEWRWNSLLNEYEWVDTTIYCPNCGAKMKGEENER